MKGLLLSGGIGSRLRPLTYTRSKQLIPIANKPILFYALDSLRNAGIKEIGVIVGETKDEIIRTLGDGSKFGVTLTFIEQEAPLGLAHALLQAESFLKNDPFVMFLGDNFIHSPLTPFLKQFKDKKSNAFLLLAAVKDPQRFGVVEIKENRITHLIEKPSNPPSDLALVGVYIFDSLIFNAAKKIKPSKRNELEITDAIQTLLNEGHSIHHDVISGWWKDTGTLEDLLEANRLALDWIEPTNAGELKGSSQIQGRVQIGKGSILVDSTIRGPVTIGENCHLQNAYVGPFTSLGNDVRIEQSEIEHSIVLQGAMIKGIGSRIQDSLLGREAKINKDHLPPHAIKLMVGDHSQVTIQ